LLSPLFLIVPYKNRDDLFIKSEGFAENSKEYLVLIGWLSIIFFTIVNIVISFSFI
jgi:hypothetical protein